MNTFLFEIRRMLTAAATTALSNTRNTSGEEPENSDGESEND